MELEWTGGEFDDTGTRYGRCRGFLVAEVLRHTQGWRAYVRGDPVDAGGYGTAGEAVAVAEAAVAGDPDPQPPAPPERRRYVRNRGPEWAPHPGTAPAHKR